jgi:endonuclease YncB( thermonuclease family)
MRNDMKYAIILTVMTIVCFWLVVFVFIAVVGDDPPVDSDDEDYVVIANQTPWRGRVARVIDADTVVVASDSDPVAKSVTIRIKSIDAPEMGQEPWGKLATKAASDLLARKRLSVTPRGADRWGRVLADIDVEGGQSLAFSLVSGGWAWPYMAPKSSTLHEAHRLAKSSKRGVWGGPQPPPIEPWIWRKQRANAQAEEAGQ